MSPWLGIEWAGAAETSRAIVEHIPVCGWSISHYIPAKRHFLYLLSFQRGEEKLSSQQLSFHRQDTTGWLWRKWMKMINYCSLFHSIRYTRDMPVMLTVSLLSPLYTQREWCDSVSHATFWREETEPWVSGTWFQVSLMQWCQPYRAALKYLLNTNTGPRGFNSAMLSEESEDTAQISLIKIFHFRMILTWLQGIQ